MNEPVLLTIQEAASRLNLGRTSIYELINAGELPTWRHGRAVRIPAKAIEELVERQLERPQGR